MNPHPLTLHDPIDDERADAALTDALHRALHTDDNDHDAFLAAVQQRAAERAPLPDTSATDEPPLLSTRLRRVASVLPPALLPKALGELGAGGTLAGTTGGLLGKSGLLGKGGLLGAVALPAITLVMLVLGALTVLRALLTPRAELEQTDDRRRATEQVLAWWRANLVPALLVTAALVACSFLSLVDAATLALLVSTLALCALFERLAAAGVAGRREIGLRAGALLTNLVGWTFILGPMLFDTGDLRGRLAVPVTLAVCGAICSTLGATAARRRVGLAVAFNAVWFGLLMTLVLWGLTSTGKRELGADDLHTWIAAGEIDPPLHGTWPELARIDQHWRAAGHARLDLAAFEHDAELRFARSGPKETDVVLALTDLGFVRLAELGERRDFAATWRELLEERELFDTRRWGSAELLATQIAVAADRLGDDDTNALAGALFTQAVDESGLQPLERLIDTARALELIGRPDLTDALRGPAHALLEATWMSTDDGERGCFASSPRLLEHMRENARGSRLGWAQVRDTSTALRALRRWGVPDGIDLPALDRWLREQARQYRRLGAPRAGQVFAVAVRADLRALPEWRAATPTPNVFELLWPWRLLVAALLLGGFALFTTWRAPVLPRDPDEPDWWADVRIFGKRS